MHLRIERGLNPNKNPELRRTLERIRITLGYDKNIWLDLLGVTESDYEKIRWGRKNLSAHSLLSLSNHINVALDLMETGKIDFHALAAVHSGQKDVLPERYVIASKSKRRTSINILDYLEDCYGWQMRHALLRQLQVEESVFTDPEKTINLRFLTDSLQFLKRRGFTNQEFAAMGAYSVVSNQGTIVGQLFSKMRSPREIYEKLFTQYSRLYDVNYEYSLEALSDSVCTVVTRSNPEVADALIVPHLGSIEGCHCRGGTGQSIPGYLGLPFSTVRETACVHRGDPVCRFELDFSDANAVLKARQTVH